jgi:diguanylate cyclase (GGDEF)-like protein
MQKLNIKFISIFFIILFIIISSILYKHHQKIAINEAEKRIEIFNKKWQALFYYVEVRQKEVFYNLERDGIITKKGYFNPEILSFTYIARQIQNKYEEIEIKNGKTPYIYRIAATSPRNPLNKATEHEAKILKKFRNNEIEKFSEFTFKNDKKFYTNYRPIERTTKTCMRCHSTPDKAPAGLVELYGDKAGFGESTGQIRGMVIMEIPFDEIEKETISNLTLVLSTVLFVFILFFIVIAFLLKKDKKLKELNTELELLSNTDMLTNLANRRYFEKYFSQQWNLMHRLDKPISLIICDIDYFKQYNDTYGHQDGDNCLSLVSKEILNTIKRESDLVARYGGEEFAIIMPDTNNESAIKITQNLLKNIKDLNIAHKKSDIDAIVTISCGVKTIIPSKENSIKEFIQNTDVLLYKAKENGRNRMEF